MSLDDGLVLQLHAGSWRGHNPSMTARFGPDKGADIPRAMDYVGALKPLLDRFGNEPTLTVVVYTLDESTYSRELAPLAGHYPALRLGPPWWFHDSPEGIRRFRHLVTETAGFANTVGFNDDARSLLSIPARHDMVRRVDAGFLAGLVAEGRLADDEAVEVAAPGRPTPPSPGGPSGSPRLTLTGAPTCCAPRTTIAARPRASTGCGTSRSTPPASAARERVVRGPLAGARPMPVPAATTT